jgi:hypothetical protein
LYRNAPKIGPKRKPRPLTASIHPMYFSLSYRLKELSIEKLEVDIAPAPVPPRS